MPSRRARRAAPATPPPVERGVRPTADPAHDRPRVAIAAVCLGVAIWSRASGGPWQTQLFITLTAAQLVLALVLRPGGAWRGGAGALWLPAAVAASLLLLVAGVYLPGLADLLRTEPIGPAEFAVAAGAGLLPAALLVLARIVGRLRG